MLSGHSKALRAAEVVADFGGVWVIAKKVFFDPSKNAVYRRILKITWQCSFGSMDTGLL